MKRLKYISAFLTLLLFVGCEKDTLVGESILQGRSIVVTTPATRASEAFDSNLSFYLYVDQSGEEYDYFVKMVNIEGEWIATDIDSSENIDMVMIDSVDDIDISALYCYEKVLSKDDYTSSETTYTEGVDLLYANINEGATLTITEDGVVVVDFKHLLSSLCINIETSEDITSANVSGVKPTLTWAASEGSSAVVAAGDSSSITSITSGEMIYLPRQVVDKLSVNITVASGNYSASVSDVQFVSTQGVELTISVGEQTSYE